MNQENKTYRQRGRANRIKQRPWTGAGKGLWWQLQQSAKEQPVKREFSLDILNQEIYNFYQNKASFDPPTKDRKVQMLVSFAGSPKAQVRKAIKWRKKMQKSIETAVQTEVYEVNTQKNP